MNVDTSLPAPTPPTPSRKEEQKALPTPASPSTEASTTLQDKQVKLLATSSGGESFEQQAIQNVKSLAQKELEDIFPASVKEGIYTLTPEAVDELFKSYVFYGRPKEGVCLWAWDPAQAGLLNLYISSAKGEKIVRHTVSRGADGGLLFEGKSFRNREEILSFLSQQTCLLHTPVQIDRLPILSHLLKGEVPQPHDQKNYFEILFKNHQYGTARKWLEANPGESGTALKCTLTGRHPEFVRWILTAFPQKNIQSFPPTSSECLQILSEHIPDKKKFLLNLARNGEISEALGLIKRDPSLTASLTRPEKLRVIGTAAALAPELYDEMQKSLPLDFSLEELLGAKDFELPWYPYVRFFQKELKGQLLEKIFIEVLEDNDEKAVVLLLEQSLDEIVKSSEFERILRSLGTGGAYTPYLERMISLVPREKAPLLFERLMERDSTVLLRSLIDRFPHLVQEEGPLLSGVKAAAQGGALKSLHFIFPILTPLLNDSRLKEALKPLGRTAIKEGSSAGPFTEWLFHHPETVPEAIYQLYTHCGIPISLDAVSAYTSSKLLEDYWSSAAIHFHEKNADPSLLSQMKNSWSSLPPDVAGKTLNEALSECNWEFIQLIQSFEVPLPPAYLYSAYKTALRQDERAFIDFLQHQGFFEKEGEKPLLMAIEWNRPAFFEALKHIPTTPGIKAKCYAEGKLTMALCLPLCLQGSVAEYVQTLSLNDPKALKKELMLLFLNSSYLDAEKVLQELAEKSLAGECKEVVSQMALFMTHEGCLISRFQDPEAQKEMRKYYGQNYPDYPTQQEAYAKKRYVFYQEAQARLTADPSCSLLDIYAILSGASHADSHFHNWRLAYPGSGESGYMEGRYSIYKKIAFDYERRLKENPAAFQGKAALGTYPQRYQVLDGDLLLTDVFIKYFAGNRQICFHHTPSSQILPGTQKILSLFSEIRQIKIPPEVQTPPEDFKRKIARIYWEAFQVELTERGNSQYALEAHHLLYDMHGFQCGPLSTVWPLPDCVGIFVDFEEFYKSYDSLFEGGIKRK